ncbi:MAG: M67 family metallopeptidase [Oscillospiraceae bacterium]|nr:M67 family metallopeptidase [Oscillospiraceae bacterium]
MIYLSEEIKSLIKTEGEKAYPNECCGVVYGNYGDCKKAISIEPIVNASEGGEQYHRFLITAEAMLNAELRARELKLDILGFYHSHPDHPAAPSEYDREHALPFYSYIIVSVANGKAGDFTSWELSSDRENFFSEEIREMN